MDSNENNDCSYLDDVEKEDKDSSDGVLYCYFRSITKKEEWPECYKALRTVLEGKPFDETPFVTPFNEMVGTMLKEDNSLATNEKLALMNYFGIPPIGPKTLKDTADMLSTTLDSKYTIDEVGVLVGNGLRKLGAIPEFDACVKEIAAKVKKLMSENQSA